MAEKKYSGALLLPPPLMDSGGDMALCRRQNCGQSLFLQGSSGFSLVEIMVAMVIGMLGVIVMMQVFAQFEGQKRTTTGGDDAISSGSIALYNLQRDIQQAGWGVSAVNVLGCYLSDKTTGAVGEKLIQGSAEIPVAPVTINPRKKGVSPGSTAAGDFLIPPGDAHTDTILVFSGNSRQIVEGMEIQSDHAATSTEYDVMTPRAFALNDFVMVGTEGPGAALCMLYATKVTEAPSAASIKVGYGVALTSKARLFHLGSPTISPVIRAYAIRDSVLTVCDWRRVDCSDASKVTDRTVWIPLADNMVSLRAQYGLDTNSWAVGGNNIEVKEWSQTLPGTTTPIGGCNMARAPAVRFVLVARSSQPEKDATPSDPDSPAGSDWSWMGNLDSGNPAAAAAVKIVFPDPDSTWPTRWNFRYKRFQSVVPLRNLTSQGVHEKCIP